MKAIKDEVLRKIGRNVLLFQKMEYMLKFLVANKSVVGRPADLQEITKRQQAAANRMTMGQLVGKFGEPATGVDGGGDSDEVFVSLSISFDEAMAEGNVKELEWIVSERNALIHNLLPSLNDHEETWLLVSAQLDVQHDRVSLQVGRIQSLLYAVREAWQLSASFIQSPEFDYQFRILNSRPVSMLCSIAQQYSRPDGWVVMNHAGKLLKDHCSKELEDLCRELDCSSLKQLMIKVGVFDLWEEPTDKGSRLLYRVRYGDNG